jgi:hypothetical protein
MTQLKDAMLAAGLESPADRLREIAVKALAEHANSWEGAKDAVFEAVRHDLALVWQLMGPYRAMAVQRLLVDITREIRGSEQTPGAGHLGTDSQKTSIPIEDAGTGNQRTGEDTDRHAARGKANAIVASKLMASMLDTFVIEGRPIGDWHAGEARAWVHRTGRHVRFVEMLTSNIPPHDPIRKWIPPETAADYWQRTADMT